MRTQVPGHFRFWAGWRLDSRSVGLQGPAWSAWSSPEQGCSDTSFIEKEALDQNGCVLPRVANLNLIPGLSGAKAQALCIVPCSLPKERWSWMRVVCLPWDAGHQLLRWSLLLCLCIRGHRGAEQWQLVLTLELSSSQLLAGVPLACQGATSCSMLSLPREGTKVRGYLLPNIQIWSEAKLSPWQASWKAIRHTYQSPHLRSFMILSPTSELKEPLLTIIKY